MAAVHDIAGGQVLDSFSITVTDVPPAAVDREALLDLLAHVPLGMNLAEVNARVDELAGREDYRARALTQWRGRGV